MAAHVDTLLAPNKDGSGVKVLLFAHHLSVLDKLAAHLAKKKSSFVRIDGRTPVDERERQVRPLQIPFRPSVAVSELL